MTLTHGVNTGNFSLGWILPSILGLVLAPNALVFAQDNALATQLHMGAEAMRNGQPQAAAGYFSEATKIAPNMAEAWMNLALARDQEGKVDQEIKALNTALNLKPALRGAHLFLGIAYYKLDDYKKAHEAFGRDLASTHPRSPQLRRRARR